MIGLTAEELADLRKVRRVSQRELAGAGRRHEALGAVDRDLIRRLAAEGFLELARAGTAERPMLGLVRLHEEVGRHCFAVRSLLTVHAMVSHLVARFGKRSGIDPARLASAEQLGAIAFSEPECGSDLASVNTRLTPESDGWRLNGRKAWVTFGQMADVFVVLCNSPGGLEVVLVERGVRGLSITPTLGGLQAARATMSADLAFEDCDVASSALLGRPGLGLNLVATAALTVGRMSVAAGAVGMARQCLLQAHAFGHSRLQFGQPIARHQAIAAMLSRMVVDVEAASLLCLAAADAFDRRESTAPMKACVAKQFAAQASVRIASDAVQIHGARGFLETSDIFRHYQDAKVLEVIEGSNEVLSGMIAEFGQITDFCGGRHDEHATGL